MRGVSGPLLALLPALLLASPGTPAAPAQDVPGKDAVDPAAVLKDHGVEPTTAGVLRFLRQYKPDADTRARVAAAVAQLGSDGFDDREAARRQLENWGAAAVGPLRAAADGDDPEVAARARTLLADWEHGERRQSNGELLDACLRWLRRPPATATTGATTAEATADGDGEVVAVLLDVLPDLPDARDRDAAAEALWARVGPADARRLRAAVADGAAALRAAAAPALEVVSAADAADAADAVGVIQPLLRSADEHVRLGAARALADRMPRPSSAALLDLLASQDPGVRLQAGWLLQQLSGVPTFPASGANAAQPKEGESAPDWAAAVESWKTWAAGAGAEHPRPLGRTRLRAARYALFLSESFARPADPLAGAYGPFRYETDVDGAAVVRDGVLRLEGNHAEGDQRLAVTPDALLGQPDFPRRFRVHAALGGEADGAGGWHVGVSVGNVRVLFHPGYDGGGFRAERVDNRRFLFNNESMPFTPAAGELQEMTIDVTRLEGGAARLAVTVRAGAGAGAGVGAAEPFTRTVTCAAADIGPIRRIALERSGRSGGAALFGRVTIRSTESEP